MARLVARGFARAIEPGTRALERVLSRLQRQELAFDGCVNCSVGAIGDRAVRGRASRCSARRQHLARLRLRPPSMRLRLASGSISLPGSAGRENLTHLVGISVVKFSSEAAPQTAGHVAPPR